MIRISIEGQGETMNAAAQDMARQIALFLQQSAPEYQAEQARSAQARQTIKATGEVADLPTETATAEPDASAHEPEENPDLSDMLAPEAQEPDPEPDEPTGPDPANILAFCVSYGKLHGGPKLKALLKQHQAGRISQLSPERYGKFVQSAKELAPDLAKVHKLV